MSVKKTFERMEKLHLLIQQKKTGSPVQLALRLGISRSSLYMLIDELSSFNIPIRYSRKYETFIYEREVELTIAFKVELFEDTKELMKINGGNHTFFVPSRILDGRNLPLYSYLAEYKESCHRL
ncbi:MAG: hypothetical protein GZ091_10615 [Paludibacter sp.]|nr:hypothetical protein [Paludibacter sp.]